MGRTFLAPYVNITYRSELLERILPSCTSKFCTLLNDGIGNAIALVAVELLKLLFRIYQRKHHQITRQEFFDKTLASLVKSFTVGAFAFATQTLLSYLTCGTAGLFIGGFVGSVIGAAVGDVLGRLVVNGVAQLKEKLLVDEQSIDIDCY